MELNIDRVIARRVTIIVAFTVSIAVILAIFYFVEFHRSRLSADPADWASFGSYLGGVLGPIVALGSLFGLALLIDLQKRTIEATREEMTASNQHFANQNFSEAVFQLIRIITTVRQTIKWNPRNLYDQKSSESDIFGELAINGAFTETFALLEGSDDWSDAHSKAILDNAYREFKLAHQAFGVYWSLVKESLDEIRFRGNGVSQETMRRGVRLFLTALSGREQHIFYILHCLNRQWERLDLFESSGVLDRVEDHVVERLRNCRMYAANSAGGYSSSPRDTREIEATGDGLRHLKTDPKHEKK